MDEMLDMETGSIKWFNPEKGYGFITKEDGTDVFLHYTGLVKGEDRRFYPGDRVNFDQVVGEKGPKAVQVHRVPGQPPSPRRNAESARL